MYSDAQDSLALKKHIKVKQGTQTTYTIIARHQIHWSSSVYTPMHIKPQALYAWVYNGYTCVDALCFTSLASFINK